MLKVKHTKSRIPGPVMNGTEVADYLQISLGTVYAHAKNGVLPAFRVGTCWRFNRRKIEDFASNGVDSSQKVTDHTHGDSAIQGRQLRAS